MTYKNLILLFILIYAAKSLAMDGSCSIKTAEKIYYLQKDQVTSNQVIIESDCDEETKSLFVRELLDLTGSVPATHFADKFPNINISPSRITVDSLLNQLQSRISLAPNTVIDSINGFQRNVLLLSNSSSLNVTSPTATIGQASLSIDIVDSLQAQSEKLWLRVTLKVKVNALVAKRELDRTQALNQHDFEKKQIITDSPDKFFIQFERLEHFALNRNVTAGHALLRTEVMTIPLVQYGVPASVTLTNNGITLSGMATPLRTAGFGEFIQLKNIKTNKTITAKVVDYNKVQIQL